MRYRNRRGGFTLIELLVVVLIVLALSILALPALITAYSESSVKGGAQILQAALNGARSRMGNPSTLPIVGVRLLHDGELRRTILPDGSSDGTIATDQPLTYSRIVPIYRPNDYAKGFVSVPDTGYPAGYPASFLATLPSVFATGRHPLIVEDAVVDGKATPGFPDGGKAEPVDWFWNVRVGEVIKIGGHDFTVCGPMVVGPADGNSEGFVNVGLPGQAVSPLQRTYTLAGNPVTYNVDFLFLTDRQDDLDPVTKMRNGWIDEGWDGIDNNLDISVPGGLVDEDVEWEVERFPPQLAGGFAAKPYSVRRRPLPLREQATELPAGTVVDATNWMLVPEWRSQTSWYDRHGDPRSGPAWDYSAIRSRLPVNRYTGDVDLIFDPNGSVTTTTFYSIPPQHRLGEDFYHFWVTAKSDAIYNVLATYNAPDGTQQANVLQKPQNRAAAIVSVDLKNGRIVAGDADNDALGVEGSILRQTH